MAQETRNSQLLSMVTFIVEKKVMRIALDILRANGVNPKLLIQEAETLIPEWIIVLPGVTISSFARIHKFLCKPMYEPPQLDAHEALGILKMIDACPSMKSLCFTYICKYLSPVGALSILAMDKELGNTENVKKLIYQATISVLHEPREVLEANECLAVPKTILHRCLDNEGFRNQPARVFYMLTRRAFRDLEIHGTQPRTAVKEFLSKVDFLDMSLKDFKSGPANSVILWDREKFAIWDNLESLGSAQLPSWFSTRRKRRGEAPFCLCLCGNSISSADLVESPFMSVASIMPLDQDITLEGVELHHLRALHTKTYIVAEVTINIFSKTLIKTRIPFPPNSTLLEIPGSPVVKRGQQCHITLKVNNKGVQLGACGQNEVIERTSKVAQAKFAYTCNLTSGTPHIHKIHVKKLI